MAQKETTQSVKADTIPCSIVSRVSAVILTGFLLGGVSALSGPIGTSRFFTSAQLVREAFGSLSYLLGSLWAWPLMAALMGMQFRNWKISTVLSMVFLVTASWAYYLSRSLPGLHYGGFDINAFKGWLPAMVIAGISMGFFGNIASRPSLWSILPRLAISSIPLLEPNMLNITLSLVILLYMSLNLWTVRGLRLMAPMVQD